jgi:uncharacterized protein (DUF885 family)
MMRNCFAAAGAACLLACSALVHGAPNLQLAVANSAALKGDAAQLAHIGDAFYANHAQSQPLFATMSGDVRYNHTLGLAIAPQQRVRHFALMHALLKRLETLDPAGLGPVEQSSYDILGYLIRNEIARESFPEHLLPIDQMMFSTPLLLASYADGKSVQAISTPNEYRIFLSRLKELTPWLDQAVLNMREGMLTGVVLPKALVKASIPAYQKLASATAQSSIFYAPIRALPASFTETEKQELTQAYRQEIDQHLNPAANRLARFLETEYLKAGRDTAGIGALLNGKAWYAAHVASATTTDLTPEQIHDIGLKEVARIQAEFAEVGPKMGYDGAPAGLPKWAGAQKKYRPFKTAEQILVFYKKLNVDIEAKLPSLFSLRPSAPLEQRLEPELTRATASDHYSPPSLDGTKPGIFWSVVNDPTEYQSTKMTTLLLHEGSPGHHFQIALQQQLPVPDFRKFVFQGAFSEGWALYAESLGKEMGLFEQPDQYFGHLNDELLRAARLVVDTGLHAKGWTREQAITYLKDTNGFTDAVASNAVERYMAWPGQALSYKIGALKISELRQRATLAMGPKFSLPAFHAVVLGSGARPLAVLDEDVKRWVEVAR